MRPRLIDWSKYQGETNLKAAVETWDLAGAIFRATIGMSVDGWYEWNFDQAMEIKEDRPEFFFGAYHVLWPWNKNPLGEAKFHASHIKVAGVSPDFTVGDFELPNDPNGWKTITPRAVANQIVAYLPAVEIETMLKALSYTGSWWWNGASHLGSVTPLGIEPDFPLIEAEYTDRWYQPAGSRDFSEAPEAPKVPAELGDGWSLADLVSWQWTSKLRPIGVSSKSQDGEVLMVTLERFREIIGKNNPGLTDHEKTTILWDKHPELHPPD